MFRKNKSKIIIFLFFHSDVQHTSMKKNSFFKSEEAMYATTIPTDDSVTSS